MPEIVLEKAESSIDLVSWLNRSNNRFHYDFFAALTEHYFL